MLVALALLVALGLLDFLTPRGSWYADHPMTSAAIAAVVGFVSAGLLLDGWVREREARRLERISTVAYRSLAQYANDAGRSLLAPLNGADLHALAIPEARSSDCDADRERLRRHGFRPTFSEVTGSWSTCDRRHLDAVLRTLLHDEEFTRNMFRRTALMRRRLQEVTGLWAPVMLTSREYADQLGRLRDLTDALELLQERLRASDIIGRDAGAGWSPQGPWVHVVAQQFWSTIDVYEDIRDDFGDLARLPSDAHVRRRAEPAAQESTSSPSAAQPTSRGR